MHCVASDKIIAVHGRNDDQSHLLNSDIERFACTAVQKEVKRSLDVNVMWHSFDSSYGASAVGYIQVYSDKSQTSLAADSLKFSPLRVILLNISDERRRKEGETTVPYLLATFQGKGDRNNGRCTLSKLSSNRVKLLSSLHECTAFCLKPILGIASCGVIYTRADGKN